MNHLYHAMNRTYLVVAVTTAAAVELVGQAGMFKKGVAVHRAGVVEGHEGAHRAGVADNLQFDRHPALHGYTLPRRHGHHLQVRRPHNAQMGVVSLALVNYPLQSSGLCWRQVGAANPSHANNHLVPGRLCRT